MFRALFSVAIVLLLSTIALLLYANYVHDDKSTSATDVGLKSSPPPVAPRADPPPAPLPAPLPAPAPVTPEKPVAVSPIKEQKETKPKSEPRPKLEPGPGQRTYVVESGDTLWSISKKNYGTPDHYNKIAELNRMTQKDRIRPGQVLIIPDLPYAAPKDEESAATKTKDEMPSDEAPKDEALADDHDHENENVATRKSSPPAHSDESSTDPEVQPPTLSIQVERK